MADEGQLFDTFNELLDKAIKQATELKQGKGGVADGTWSYWGYVNARNMPFHMRNVTRFYGLFIEPILKGYIDILYPQLLLNPGKGIAPYIINYDDKSLILSIDKLKSSTTLPKGYSDVTGAAFRSQLGAKDEYLTVDFQTKFLEDKIPTNSNFDYELLGCSQITAKVPNEDVIQLKKEFDKHFKKIGLSGNQQILVILITSPTNGIIKTDAFNFYLPPEKELEVIYELEKNKDSELVKYKYDKNQSKIKGIRLASIKFGSPFYKDKTFIDKNVENLGTQNGWELYLKCREAYVKLWNQYWDWNPRVTIGIEPGSELLYGYRTANFKENYGARYDWTKIDTTKSPLQDFIFPTEILNKEDLKKLKVNSREDTKEAPALPQLAKKTTQISTTKK